ncbi:hypothetical protein [Campylobacter corcagiensis]|uniref:Uncharacterized protein n=1 Tax=Campylobacter corcagiensis TaxID=1448857 RepID=A0A7M1LF22_9BACT|nr:hypothetical protein [Campylobacter corcagiensis]QKF64688.1 hypothetical protein CCORG_0831 [Campylobacter corcagiensis]QOQ87148.1 hypothetical protein IMC76_08025 [Campylobacter corcagiensis]
MKENAIYISNLENCVKDYYISNGKINYVNFNNEIFTSIDFPKDIYTNFIYDTDTKICYMSKNEIIPNLGIYEYQFNFLMGLTAILIAFSFLIGLIIVGATR